MAPRPLILCRQRRYFVLRAVKLLSVGKSLCTDRYRAIYVGGIVHRRWRHHTVEVSCTSPKYAHHFFEANTHKTTAAASDAILIVSAFGPITPMCCVCFQRSSLYITLLTTATSSIQIQIRLPSLSKWRGPAINNHFVHRSCLLLYSCASRCDGGNYIRHVSLEPY